MLYDKITELCYTLGTSVPEVDEQGSYFFSFDGGLELTCSEYKNSILLSSPIASLPDTAHEVDEMCREVLHTSLGIMQNSPDVVALDDKDSKIILYRKVKEDRHQTARFVDAVEEFLNTLEFLKNTVGKKKKASIPPPMFGGGMQRF